ncbi:hypothetical protein [Massilia antarctica]|uniref:hypothetical protein n=1 Tax=Massilia antarctica TaxID=2765360 RepID=UPI0006BB7FC8|nr:hypothetical protein [Massilia sp. H27-R4]MCY0910769.1 hypothetical protein [Massilia sp. H27-R4]CUI08850.1 hypothetical protein BN2497_12477 [Janthinobacterium sp. CG23_2]CUU32636.1 hypothetical protein BN3177_12477 [Janthinobacterium sp. CG23_2]
MHPNPSIASIRARLLGAMAAYVQRSAGDPDSEAPYGKAEIDECAGILDAYAASVDKLPKPAAPAAIMKEVEKVVLALNAFDERCNVIETEERESLCDIIYLVARDAGLEADEDITEQWREW